MRLNQGKCNETAPGSPGLKVLSTLKLSRPIKLGRKIELFRLSLSLGPKQELANICASECLLVIDGDPEPYQIAAYDRIMIEEGQLFYRSEEDAAAGADQKEETEDDPEPTPAPAPDEGGTR